MWTFASLTILLVVVVATTGENGCDDIKENRPPLKILYSVSSQEGFNLRRDVYLRLAVAVRRAPTALVLALPPFSRIPHWHANSYRKQFPWSVFFQIEPLKQYAPVAELADLVPSTELRIDRLYRLTHFENAFEGGHFKEKWEFRNSTNCPGSVDFWGYNTVVENNQCVAFQGSASKIFELLALHPYDETVMFTNAEILLHDDYGTAEYWRARKSVQFSKNLIAIAEKFILEKLECNTYKCLNYFSLHWRRGDFARGRPDQVPSVNHTANQIVAISKKPEISLKVLFVATDSSDQEFDVLKIFLENEGLNVIRFDAKNEEIDHIDGAIAIIDQIICSKSAYFIGTHESTFTFRIQEEREIMGFDSDTTFNRLCPDKGTCEKPSRWKIVN